MPLLWTDNEQWVDVKGQFYEFDVQAPANLQLATPSNTGCRIPEEDLTVFNGSITSTHPGTGLPLVPGDVVEGFDISGRIDPRVGGLTFRDCIVRGGMPNGQPSNPSVANTWALVDHRHNGITALNRFEYVTLAPSYLSHDIYGFRGGNYIALYCYVGPVIDGFNPHGSAEAWKSAFHWGCYMEFAHHEEVDPRQSDGTHDDNLQAQGKLNRLELLKCDLRGSHGNTVLLQKGQGSYGMIKINDNKLGGMPDRGGPFNMSETMPNPNGPGTVSEGYPEGGLEVFRNIVDRNVNHESPAPFTIKANSRFPSNFGCTGTNGSSPSTWTPGPNANVYADNGQPVPLKAG